MATAEDRAYECLFKLLFVGDSGVGKSSILLRYTDDQFDEEHACTIGVDFKIKYITCKGKRVNLTIWDTAGQEKFRSLTSSYYRGTHAIVLVYDVTKKETFEHVGQWLNEVRLYSTNPDAVLVLVGNKTDKAERQVSRDQGVEFARSNGMLFFECSAKTREGIQQAFDEMVCKMIETPSLWGDGVQRKPKPIQSPQPDQQGGACYC
eukprot:m51a1_g6308 putative ras-related protein rab-18 (206) ;mRNA; r:319830-321200